MFNVLPEHNSNTTEEQMFEDVEGLILRNKSDGSVWSVCGGFREPYDDFLDPLDEVVEVESKNILKIPIKFN